MLSRPGSGPDHLKLIFQISSNMYNYRRDLEILIRTSLKGLVSKRSNAALTLVFIVDSQLLSTQTNYSVLLAFLLFWSGWFQPPRVDGPGVEHIKVVLGQGAHVSLRPLRLP